MDELKELYRKAQSAHWDKDHTAKSLAVIEDDLEADGVARLNFIDDPEWRAALARFYRACDQRERAVHDFKAVLLGPPTPDADRRTEGGDE